MLIYARLILVLILLSACFQIIGGTVVVLGGLGSASYAVMLGGLMSLAVGGVFAWLAWTNYSDAANCANEAFMKQMQSQSNP
jgi:heme A synthase